MAGNAARKAGFAIRRKLVAAAARLTGYPEEGFDCRDEQVIYLPNPEIRVTYDEALTEALAENGALIAKGSYVKAPPMGGTFKGAAAGLSPTYSFQAYVSEVSVDPAAFKSLSRNTPFAAHRFTGRPVMTVVGGSTAWQAKDLS